MSRPFLSRLTRLLTGLLATTAALLALAATPALAAERLRLAVVPQFPAEEIDTTWSPILKRVSALSGIQIDLVHYRSISAFELGFAAQEADLLYLNPYHVIMANRSDYSPLLRDANEKLSGILVVRKDSPVQRLEQLEGATIAFPAPTAFGASLYMRALLSREAHLAYTPTYRGTHSNVFRHVIAGLADAGGAIQSTLDREDPEIREQLRVIFETPPSPAHPLAAHARVTLATRAKLLAAFASLAKSPDGRQLLQAVRLADPVPSSYADYERLEQLKLEQFVDGK